MPFGTKSIASEGPEILGSCAWQPGSVKAYVFFEDVQTQCGNSAYLMM